MSISKVIAKLSMETSGDFGGIHAPYTLTDGDLRFYRQRGYIKLPNVFEPETLNHYRKVISSKVKELNSLTKPMEERTLYEKAFLQVMNLWIQSEEVKAFVFGRKLAKIASDLMGCKGVRIYHDQALYKEAGGGLTPWHADQYYWPVASDKTITAWIPLQKTPLEMGPLAFAAESYKLVFGRNLEIGEESEKTLKKTLRDFDVDEGPFELGEVSFHSGWTFHRAGPNLSRKPREVMTVIYIDKDMKLAEPRNKDQTRDWEWWAPGIEVGQTVASPLNPVLYESQN